MYSGLYVGSETSVIEFSNGGSLQVRHLRQRAKLRTVVAENTGDTAVRIPAYFDIWLVDDSFQSEASVYKDESERYEGGKLAPGVRREGVVLFEVPASVTSYTIQVELADGIMASWEV